MKKYKIAIATALLMLLLGVTCSAQVVEDEAFGLRFELSEGWQSVSSGEGTYHFSRGEGRESLSVECTYEGHYLMEQLADPETMESIYKEVYSEEAIAQTLGETNGLNSSEITITPTAAQFTTEIHNGQTYYIYSKGYTAEAPGFMLTEFFNIGCTTVQNGYLYFVSYEAIDMTPKGEEVANVLDTMDFSSGEIEIFVNDERIYPDSAPIIQDGRTLVPIRAVAGKMGYEVSWDAEARLVTLASADGGNVLEFTIDSSVAVINGGEGMTLDVPAQIFSDRTYLPLRAVADGMGAEINWNGDERVIDIRG